MKKRRRNLEKEQFWRLVLAEHAESGLSVRGFCKRESLAEPSFYAWRRELKKRDARHVVDYEDQLQSLIPVNVLSEGGSDRAAPRRSETSRIEIIVPNGLKLRLAADVDPSQLRALLDVVSNYSPTGEFELQTC